MTLRDLQCAIKKAIDENPEMGNFEIGTHINNDGKRLFYAIVPGYDENGRRNYPLDKWVELN